MVCYRDAVMKSIPDVHTLISLRQQLSGSEGKEPAKVDTLSLDDQMRNLGLSLSLSPHTHSLSLSLEDPSFPILSSHALFLAFTFCLPPCIKIFLYIVLYRII